MAKTVGYPLRNDFVDSLATSPKIFENLFKYVYAIFKVIYFDSFNVILLGISIPIPLKIPRAIPFENSIVITLEIQ